jgi:hypothetical protein
VACCGLMGSSPARPGDDLSWLDASLFKPVGDAAYFLDRPADQSRTVLRLLFGGVLSFARLRITASMANASMTSDT